MEGVVFPHAWCEGYAALVQHNPAEARRKFIAAREEIEKVTIAQPDFAPAHSVLGLSEAMLGNRERAIREGKRAVELLPVTKDALNGAVLLQNLAVIYAWSAQPKLAVKTIEQALAVPSEVSYGFLRLHPFWDPLRGDAKFENIVARQAPGASRP
jgi:tetratricopeptide (TPR) repeat protein